MKRTNTAKILVLLACCLLLTACPPNGGDLVPVTQGEGAELSTTKFKDDTLRVTHEAVSVRGRGVWSVADSDTSVILEISNAKIEPVIVDLGRCELFNDESKEKLVLRSVSDETTAKGGPTFLSDKVIRIDGGQERKLALEFKMNSADGRSSVSRNVLGQTATLRLPVMLKGETPVQVDKDERPAQVDFVLTFKYAESQGQR
ncbi:MAG TPA: hypothetical protein VGO91_05780 [Pyrinomonadaceae bacterium]|jgi:hypothetical protein|nr:hypothetical protein [Pyrinomonadaceae bacterium]